MTEREARLQRLRALQASGRDPFRQTRYDRSHTADEIRRGFSELDGTRVRICGRIMGRRGHGRAQFLDLEDASGRIQVFASLDGLGDEGYASLDLTDLGDHMGVAGVVFRTRRGEISVRADETVLLAKSLAPLPEKWHGLQDTETRFRRRYLDLATNADVRELFARRSGMIAAIRNMLCERGFLEVETPMMQAIPGGATAHPFVTHHRALDMTLYLRVAPELYLKRLIVGGYERVFEINRNFRNEGMDRSHNPEFTMLELYQAYADYGDMMTLTEDIVATAVRAVRGGCEVVFGEHSVDVTPPWRRLSVREALAEFAGIELDSLLSESGAARIAEERSLRLDCRRTPASVLSKVLDEYVEPRLIGPTHLVDYPVCVSPLAKRKPCDERIAERFESFICGQELANAFSELNDPLDQRSRFEQQMAERAAGDEEAHPMDEDFLEALEHGMPPTGGLGIGMDRLFMLLSDRHSIREVILFPLMRPDD